MKREAAKASGAAIAPQDNPSADPAPKPEEPYSSILKLDTKRPDAETLPKPAQKPAAKTENAPQQAPALPYDPSKANVRKVGPQFLPGKDTTMDLRHPKDATAN